MADGFNFQRLRAEVLACSNAQLWEAAKKEWQLIAIHQAGPDEPETCLCGHHPILELCVIWNATTDITVTVGNKCIKRFLGLKLDAVFNAIKRIRKDKLKSMGPDLAAWLHKRNALTEWEYGFVTNTLGTRAATLSQKQMAQRERINRKALNAVRRHGIN